mmetsp:Transcript_13652/g.15069  ORF Transcript_13652/g.15069 Transcript_13652/m.15069 type:complete len:383 (+) Transcript_13652:51-1199(+)
MTTLEIKVNSVPYQEEGPNSPFLFNRLILAPMVSLLPIQAFKLMPNNNKNMSTCVSLSLTLPHIWTKKQALHEIRRVWPNIDLISCKRSKSPKRENGANGRKSGYQSASAATPERPSIEVIKHDTTSFGANLFNTKKHKKHKSTPRPPRPGKKKGLVSAGKGATTGKVSSSSMPVIKTQHETISTGPNAKETNRDPTPPRSDTAPLMNVTGLKPSKATPNRRRTMQPERSEPIAEESSPKLTTKSSFNTNSSKQPSKVGVSKTKKTTAKPIINKSVEAPTKSSPTIFPWERKRKYSRHTMMPGSTLHTQAAVLKPIASPKELVLPGIGGSPPKQPRKHSPNSLRPLPTSPKSPRKQKKSPTISSLSERSALPPEPSMDEPLD